MRIYLDRKSAIKKQLCSEKDYSLYFKVVNLYKRIFEKYLCSVVNIKNYDNAIVNSNLGVGTSEIKEKRVNYIKEYLNLKYIVNINLFFVENLSISDIDVFRAYINGDTEQYSKLVEIVKRTYKDVLKENSEKTIVNYISYVEADEFRNGALAFRIRYTIEENTSTTEEFLQLNKERDLFLEKIMQNIKAEIEEKLNVKCDIIKSLERNIDMLYRWAIKFSA